jgi:hypothetical protein
VLGRESRRRGPLGADRSRLGADLETAGLAGDRRLAEDHAADEDEPRQCRRDQRVGPGAAVACRFGQVHEEDRGGEADAGEDELRSTLGDLRAGLGEAGNQGEGVEQGDGCK